MSYYDGFAPAYTIRLQIEREDRMILDTAITVKQSGDEIARAKKHIRKLLDDYAPIAKPADTEPQESSIAETESEPEEPETPAPEPPPETEDTQPGVKGLICLVCPDCKDSFGIFLHNYKKDATCKCGHLFNLRQPLARFRFICPYCGKEVWGKTNSEEADLTVRCWCGKDVILTWNPAAKEYRN